MTSPVLSSFIGREQVITGFPDRSPAFFSTSSTRDQCTASNTASTYGGSRARYAPSWGRWRIDLAGGQSRQRDLLTPFLLDGWLLCSNSPKQKQYYENDDDKSDDSARSIPPTPAVPPCWQHAHQRQDQNNKKYRANAH